MSDGGRREERERRDLAEQHAGEVIEGTGRAMSPRRLGDMVSLRLEPELAEALRELARARSTSLSGLLREGALCLLAHERASRATFTWNVTSIPSLPSALTPTESRGLAPAT